MTVSLHLKGEPFPALVEKKVFCGIAIYKIEGSEQEIRLTTQILEKKFPLEKYCTATFGDAAFIGNESGEPIYELIVMRKLRSQNVE